MKPRVKVVTDSTADIPSELAAELDIGVIHDYINFGATSLRDRIDISRAEFYDRLTNTDQSPTTAAPGVGEFEAAYREMGAPEVEIVSLHPPAHFSALYNNARLAAQSFPDGVVTAVDTGQLSMGIGWLVIEAARAAQAGKSIRQILDLVTAIQPRIRLVAALDTFEYLRRSGRVGWTQALVGTLLRIKPLIEVRDGQILPLERVRTRQRAMARLVELTESSRPLASLAILHTNWPQGAKALRERLADCCPDTPPITVDVTPVIGVHVGPEGLGVAIVAGTELERSSSLSEQV